MAVNLVNRIIGLERIPASRLVPHPDNWRIHPEKQRAVLSRLLHKIGYVGAITARPIQGGKYQIIDGHLRAELTSHNDIPVLIADITEREAKEMLASGDLLAGMADTDMDALESLIKEVNLSDSSTAKILAEIDEFDFALPEDETLKIEQVDVVVPVDRFRCPHCQHEFEQ